MSDLKHMKIIVRGKVQGVGFRYKVNYIAKEINLTGWVLNRLDGTVEIRIEGRRSKCEMFVKQLQELGHSIAISSIESEELYNLAGYNHFEIRYF